MRVYAVRYSDYDSGGVVSVHATLAGAEAKMEASNAEEEKEWADMLAHGTPADTDFLGPYPSCVYYVDTYELED